MLGIKIDDDFQMLMLQILDLSWQKECSFHRHCDLVKCEDLVISFENS